MTQISVGAWRMQIYLQDRGHKFGLQLRQLSHHILRKYSLTQANPKA